MKRPLFLAIALILFSGKLIMAGKSHSELFNKIFFKDTELFVGLNIGDSKEKVITNLGVNALVNDDENYLYYTWNYDNAEYTLNIYFEKDKLNSIDAYVYFYNRKDNYDKKKAKNFYAEMENYFNKKYPNGEVEKNEDYKYKYWYLENLDVSVGLNEGQVYWHFYDYTIEIDKLIKSGTDKELALIDFVIDEKDDMFGLNLGDTRVKTRALIPKNNFISADLNYLGYYWNTNTEVIYLDIDYNEKDEISLMLATFNFYDEAGLNAKAFSLELKNILFKRHGETVARNNNDGYGETTQYEWNLNDKIIKLTQYFNQVDYEISSK